MLDKLLGNLKKSLPESLRGKMGSEETQEEEYSEQESEESHDTSDNETPPEDKKKKTNQHDHSRGCSPWIRIYGRDRIYF